MREVVVLYPHNHVDAEVAAGLLRANHLHPRVARDDVDAMLGVAGGISAGRHMVLVPETEERAARALLRPSRRRRRIR